MKETGFVRASQLCAMVFLSLAVGMAVRPFTADGAPAAQVAIPAALLDTAVAALALTPALRQARRGEFAALSGGMPAAKLLLAPAAALLAFAAARETACAEAFFRYVSDEPLPQLLVYAVILLAAGYALHCGLAGLLRVFGLAAGVFLLSMLLMLVSNLGGIRLSNLAFAPFEPGAVLYTAAAGFRLPAELLLFFLFVPGLESRNRLFLRRTLGLLCLFYIGLSFCTEAVLGPAAQAQAQTAHTLSRLGSLSVFRRLDAMHTAAWMLAELCRVAALLCGAARAVRPLLPPEKRACANRCAMGACLAFLALCAGAAEWVSRLAVTAGVAVLLAGFTICEAGRGWVHAKKGG